MGFFNSLYYTQKQRKLREQRREEFKFQLEILYDNYRRLQGQHEVPRTNIRRIENPFSIYNYKIIPNPPQNGISLYDLKKEQQEKYNNMIEALNEIVNIYNDYDSNMTEPALNKLEELLVRQSDGGLYDFNMIKNILKTAHLVPYPTKSSTEKLNMYIGAKPAKSFILGGCKRKIKRHQTKKRRSSSMSRKHRNISSRVKK
jgi:hypothetical protein